MKSDHDFTKISYIKIFIEINKKSYFSFSIIMHSYIGNFTKKQSGTVELFAFAPYTVCFLFTCFGHMHNSRICVSSDNGVFSPIFMYFILL